jgi:hypothetical protein
MAPDAVRSPLCAGRTGYQGDLAGQTFHPDLRQIAVHVLPDVKYHNDG